MLVVLIIFVSVLIISTVIAIPNKIKEGKYIGREGVVNNTIAVSGQGKVYVKPDLAMIDFTVSAEASAVSRAMDCEGRRRPRSMLWA